MKSFKKSLKMRYFFLAPMVVLAMVACAKRDSDFSKRAAEKRAAEKTTPDTNPKKDPASGTSPANPTTPKTPTTPTTPTDPVDPTKPADPETPVDPKTDTDDGEETTLYSKKCDPLKEPENKDDDEVVQFADLLNNKGSYVLDTSTFQVDYENDSSKTQFNGFGSKIEMADNLDNTTKYNNKIIPSCHTIADASQVIREMIILPYKFSAENGKVEWVRQDMINIKNNPETIQVTSSLSNLNALLGQMLNVLKQQTTQIVKHTDKSVTIRFQRSATDSNSGMTRKTSISARYIPTETTATPTK